jgi:apolipoprotein N-acyltransferase
VTAIVFTSLFVVVVSTYYGLAGWVGQRLSIGKGRGVKLLLIYPAVWLLTEWLRGWLLTGFPWLALGYSQSDSPLKGFAPLLGVYGVSLVLVLSATLILFALLVGGRQRVVAICSAILLWMSGWILDGVSWTSPVGEPLRVSLIQGNIDQEVKWQRDQLAPTLELYTELTMENSESDLIIWPETAVPAFLYRVDEEVLTPVGAALESKGSQLLVGIPLWDRDKKHYYNAMVSRGGVTGSYHKRHLVPLGEYTPLEQLLQPFIDWMEIPLSQFSAGAQEQPLMILAGHPVGISICYEDAFGEEVITALPEAKFLINASNDSWFGDSLAPPQHLQIARMRSLETGRYLLRATNTGISALIGPKGELVDYAPPFEVVVLTGEMQPMAGMTPYAQVGNYAVVILALLLLLLAMGWRFSPESATGQQQGQSR